MKFIFLCSFLLAQVVVFSQPVHELKTDVLFPIFKGVNCSYEFVPARRLGIEASLRYQWGMEGYAYYSDGTDYFVDEVTAHKSIGVLISARYYLSNRQNGTGWYAGAYYRGDQWVSKVRSDGFPNNNRNTYFHIYANGLGTYYSDWSYKRNLRMAVGLSAGYKHCFRQHFVLDLCMGTDANLYALFSNVYFDFNMLALPSVKLGYRL